MDVLSGPFSTLDVRLGDGVIHVTLNRGGSLNAVNLDMALELHAVLAALETVQRQPQEADAHQISSLVLYAPGGCVGVDIAAADGDDSWDYKGSHSQELLSSLVGKLFSASPVVVFVADGPIVGLGFGLWLASDLRVATARATFRCGFSGLGLSNCDMGVSWMLPKVVGYAAASKIMLVDEAIPAEEALAHNLSHYVDGDLTAATLRAQGLVAKMRSRHSRMGLNLTKKQLKTSVEGSSSLSQALVAENAIQTMLLSREDVMKMARATLAGLGRRSKL